MKKEYKLFKIKDDKQNFYIFKGNCQIAIKQLSLQDLLIVGIVNKISHFDNLVNENQKINSYTDLKNALEFCSRVSEKIPKHKAIKSVRALDDKGFLARVEEYAQMGNRTPLEIARKFSFTEEKTFKEK